MSEPMLDKTDFLIPNKQVTFEIISFEPVKLLNIIVLSFFGFILLFKR